MAKSNESFFDDLEQEFETGSTGKTPIPMAEFSPIHGLLQYAHNLQGDLRQLPLKEDHKREIGNAATHLLNEQLRSLNPQELALSFIAIKSFALLDQISEKKRELFDFGGIYVVSGTPKEFISGYIYDRPTISLAFEDSEFLSEVPIREEFPEIPADNLAIPVYSLRV